MISPEEALARVLAKVLPLPVEEADLPGALGRALAEDVRADVDLPPFTRSAMDGFAVRSTDLAAPPVDLAIADEIAAGAVPRRNIGPGECARIMTGAPVPGGADAVVMVERTEPAASGRVRILATARPAENVIPRGCDARAGTVVLPAGTVLSPGAIAVSAAVGRIRLRVHRRPRAAFLSTGDELVGIERRPGPGQVRNSNAHAFAAQLALEGGTLALSRIVPDTVEETRRAIREGLAADLLVLSGGVSMGEFDFVARALAEEEVEIHFHKIALKPGRPLLFGTRGETAVFGLPGNPVSSYMTFLLFVAPALRRMLGRRDPEPRHVTASLAGGPLRTRDRIQYVPARLEPAAGGFSARPLTWHGSGDLLPLHAANGFIAVPVGDAPLVDGAMVRVLVDERQIAPFATA